MLTPTNSSPSSNRRQFLKQATTATAVTTTAALLRTPVYGQNQAPSTGRVLGANDRLVVAVIGLSRGRSHISGHAGVKNVEIGYVCDVDANRVKAGQAAALKAQSREAKGEGDFRRLLENKDIDVISIAAPNYWHTIMAIMACQAGKQVYVEKPGSHNPFEAEAIVAAAKKYGRPIQMGNQRRSYPMVIEGMQRLREGAIGRVQYSRCWYKSDRGSIGTGKPAPVPAHLDWKLWQGPCPERPFVDNLVHYNWHWRWTYGGGELGNNGVHMLDLVRWGLGVDYPTKVTYLGGRYSFRDDQETPDMGTAQFDFGTCGGSWDQSSTQARKGEQAPAIAFYGDKGSLVMSGGDDYTIFDLDGKQVAKQTGKAEDHPHFQNFADAIRLGKKLNSPISEGQKSAMLCHLGNIALRTGSVLEVDPKNGRILKNTAAMKLWKREYRAGWEPKGFNA